MLKKFKIEIDIFDIIIFIAILSLIFYSFIGENKTNLLQCEKCNESKLAYVDTLNYQNGTTFYRYQCNNCGRLFRTKKWRGK